MRSTLRPRCERLLLACVFVLLRAALCLGQSTAVTLQVTDTDTQSWNNGSWIVTLYSPPGVPPGPYKIVGSGLPVPNQTQSGSLSGSGGASLTLTPNASIVPSGTQWQFNVCAQATPWPCVQSSGTIAGVSQTVLPTPPGIRINVTNPIVVVTAYQDLEITGQVVGSAYYNLTTLIQRQWNGSAWVNSSGGAATNPTSGVMPVNSSGTFIDSPVSVDANSNIAFGTLAAATPSTSHNSLYLTTDGTHSAIIELHNIFAQGINNFVHTSTAFRSPVFNFYRSNGTQTVPLATTFTGYEQNPQALIDFGGYDGTAYQVAANIIAYSQDNWTGSARGMCLELNTTFTGSLNNQARMQWGCKDSTGVGGQDILVYTDMNWGKHAGPGIHSLPVSGNTQALVIQNGDGTGAMILGGSNTGSNTQQITSNFTTAASTNLQLITDGPHPLRWLIGDTARNYSFHCHLAYFQATGTATVAFGIQAVTNAPTNIFATGEMYTAVGTVSGGVLPTLTTTTATNIVTGTPGAINTNLPVDLYGTLELAATLNNIQIMVSTSNSADLVTVLRGSYCSLNP